MIIQFKCSNHRSIKEEVTFSLAATKDSDNNENCILFGSNKYLRCAEIYGANGSGKTTLLNAMQIMTALVQNSNNHQPGDHLIRAPHKLSNVNEPTSFSIIFVKNNIKYSYGFSYVDDDVTEEYLYYWPGRKKARIFERESNAIYEFSPDFEKQGANCEGRLKKNKLLLSCAANETDIKEIAEAFLFFKEDLVIYPGDPNNWFAYSAEQLSSNLALKASFIKFMQSIGSDLKDIKIKVEKRPLSQNELPPGFPIELRSLILKQGGMTTNIELKIIYEKFSVDFNEESSGVQKLFHFLCPLIDILHSGKIFICDEIETHLHPSIVSEILKRFCLNSESNGQIILTTHDTDLLDLDFIRRDQIWFTELRPAYRSTDLYSLSDLKNVRKEENKKKGYVSGKYGAIPILGSSTIEEVKNVAR